MTPAATLESIALSTFTRSLLVRRNLTFQPIVLTPQER